MNKQRSFLQIIKSHISGNKTALPVFDATGLRIQREAVKEDPNIRAIERMIACDPALTSQILHISNSAFYKGLQKVSTVHGAIMRLGSKEIARIAILASQKRHFRSKDRFINQIMHDLWRHSVGTAIAAQWIANRTGQQKIIKEAFTAGLLHDVGKLLILNVTDSLQRNGALKNIPFTSFFSEVLDNFHCQFGYALLRYWNLPENYACTARDHHTEEPNKEDDLLMTIRLADKATNNYGICIGEPKGCILAATEEADHFGLSEIALAELEIKLEDSKTLA